MDEEEDADGLPSYNDAKEGDPWPFILPYLKRNDLISLGYVNTRLRNRVQGHLWLEPRRFWPEDAADAFGKGQFRARCKSLSQLKA